MEFCEFTQPTTPAKAIADPVDRPAISWSTLGELLATLVPVSLAFQ
jgi:hypothetical protein